MFAAIKRAGKDGTVYGIGQGLQGAVAFLLVPIYVRSLSQSDFGKLGILLSIATVSGIIVSMGLNSAIFRSYFDYEDIDRQRQVISTTLVLLLTNSLLIITLGVFVIPLLAIGLFDNKDDSFLLWLALAKGVSISLSNTTLAVYRARGQSVKYSVITVLTLLFKVILIIYLVVFAQLGLSGAVVGDVITAGVAAIIMLFSVRSELVMQFSSAEARKLLAFGIPLVPADLASMVFVRADLFFLNHYTNLAIVGQYNVAAMVIQAIQLLIKTPFMLIWTPLILEVEKKDFARKFYARITIYILILIGFVALLVSVFSAEIIQSLAGSSYELAIDVLPLLALAQVFYIVQIAFGAGITLKRKTQFVPLILGIVAIITLASNMIFVPRWGLIGAGVANLLSAVSFAVITYVISQRIFHIQQNWSRITLILMGYGSSFLAARLIENSIMDAFPNVRLSAMLVAVLALSSVALLYSLEGDEKMTIKRVLNQLRA